MGGTALKHLGFESRRVSADEYFTLVPELEDMLHKVFSRARLVESYLDKPDHGDIDFICLQKEDGTENEWRNLLKEFKCFSHFVHHPGQTSFAYKGVQIDLTIEKTAENFLTKSNYYDWAPLGNILGQMYRQVGLKFGGDGLSYKVRENECNLLGVVPVSTSMLKILRFAGLDYLAWSSGFCTQEEIFGYCAKSRFFNREAFDFDNLDHANRTRNRKRKDYQAWMEWLEKTKPENRFEWLGKSVTREEWLPIINEAFPEANLLEKISEIKEAARKRNKIAEKFNGRHVMEWANVTGAKVGELKKAFQEHIELDREKKGFTDWVESSSEEEIRREFIKFAHAFTFAEGFLK